MLLLWGLMAAMAALAGYWVARPLLGNQHTDRSASGQDQTLSREAINLALYRDRVAELDADLARGQIDAETHRQLAHELDHLLLADTAQSDQQVAVRSPAVLGTTLLVFLIVPLSTLGLYVWRGHADQVAAWLTLQDEVMTALERMANQTADSPETEPSFSMLDYLHVLQHQAQRDADNPQLWYQVGLGYLQVNAAELAKPALERAQRLDPATPQYNIALAQALIAEAQGKLTPEADQILVQVLAQNPRHVEALMLRAMSAFAAERYDLAIAVWTDMLALGDGRGEGADILRRSIAVAEARRSAPEKAAQVNNVITGPHIRITVAPAAELQSQLTGKFLLVFARANDGSPMPLAVVRQPVTGWPVEIILSDAQAMIEQRRLSDFSSVDVVVRISATGDARAQPGDWQLQWSDVKPGTDGVALRATDFQRIP